MRWSCSIAWLAATLSCEAHPAQVRWLQLVQVRPENHVGVFLNEKIQLHFSEPLDPTSVDRNSVRITAQDGTPARGELRVDEERLVFVPDPVLAFDLSDGGYKPGEIYYVDLAGFPVVNGLRARGGAPLARNLRFEFRTVDVSQPGFVFEDSSQSRGLRVILRGPTISPGDPIVLEGEEPLDPSTLYGEDFVLQRELVEQQAPGRTRPPLSPPIPLRARLTQNHDRGEPLAPASHTTLIELVPLDRLLEPGRYWLNVDADKLRLRDFGGNRVKIWAREPSFSQRLEITVVPRADGPEVASWFLESFLDPRRRSFEWLDGFDGTARWSGSGRVELHWPVAALDGCDGEVQLSARESRRDIHSTRLGLSEGSACELDARPGLVILRAQGKLVIAGELRRRTRGGSTGSEGGLDDTRAPFMDLMRQSASLSEALIEAWAADMDATVLIAGGDLVIEGRIDCDQPVLLVAGGRIRASRGDVVGARGLYYLGEGGGVLQDRNAPPQRALAAVESSLELDEPSVKSPNPLAVPLSWAAVSSSIPPVGGARRWHVAPSVVAHDGIGQARVRYLGERVERTGITQILVDDPGALSDCPTLRLRIELHLPAMSPNAARWDPPWVDDVLLQFDRATIREAR